MGGEEKRREEKRGDGMVSCIGTRGRGGSKGCAVKEKKRQ